MLVILLFFVVVVVTLDFRNPSQRGNSLPLCCQAPPLRHILLTNQKARCVSERGGEDKPGSEFAVSGYELPAVIITFITFNFCA